MIVALLSGARTHRQLNLSQKLYNRMRDLFANQKEALVAASILLSNTYSSFGHREKAAQIRTDRIIEIGQKVKSGVSWTEVNGEIVVNNCPMAIASVRLYSC
jgi:hypothetical protein